MKFYTKAWKKKKKKYRQYDQRYQQQKSFTPVTKINTALLGELNQKKKDQNWSDKTTRDFSWIKYYNCQKLSHYANNYLKLKNQFES